MPAGRPPIFKTPKAMQEAVDAFFAKCAEDEVHPTVSGLAYHLGMTTETLRTYGAQDQFSATVKTGKQRIEMHLEQNLYGTAVTGTIFNLKNNFDWKDQRDVTVGNPDGSPLSITFNGIPSAGR